MRVLHRLIFLIPLALSLSFSICLGQIERSPGEKDIKSLFFNPKVGPEEIRRVVILPIYSEGEGLGHAPGITELLLANLRKIQRYDLLSVQDVKGLVEKKGMDRTKLHHYPNALEIGKSLGVEGVIVGSLSEYGTMGDRAHFALNLRMIRIPEGDTAWSMSCSSRGKPKDMEEIAGEAIGSVVRSLIHRWRSDGATTAWGIKLQPLEASGGYSYIALQVPQYEETEIKEYIVSRGIFESGPYVEIKRVGTKKKDSLTFKDDNVQTDRNYFYRYRVVTKMGFVSPPSEAVEARLGKPSAPRGLTVISDVIREVPLSWTPSPEPEVKGYRVYRSDSKGGPYRLIGKVDGKSKTSFVDSQGLMDETEYYYQITAFNVADVEGDPTEPISATTRGKPLAPQGLKAKAGMLKSISIEWTQPPDPEVRGYIVYRSFSPEGPFEEIQKIKEENKTSFLDGAPHEKKLDDGTLYHYKVRSYNKVDVLSEESEMVSARTKRVPQPPLGLNAVGGQVRRISLTWRANPEKDIKHYVVYRSEDAGEGYKKITTVPGDKTDFIDAKRADGATHSYKVKAIDADGLESEFSEAVSAMTKRLPSVPKGIKAEGGRRKVTLSWEANPEADISRYHIYRKIIFGFKKIGSPEGTSYTDESLRDGKTYRYKVTAEDRDGLESPFSEEISATTAPK